MKIKSFRDANVVQHVVLIYTLLTKPPKSHIEKNLKETHLTQLNLMLSKYVMDVEIHLRQNLQIDIVRVLKNVHI